jgi:hypothetical protein
LGDILRWKSSFAFEHGGDACERHCGDLAEFGRRRLAYRLKDRRSPKAIARCTVYVPFSAAPEPDPEPDPGLDAGACDTDHVPERSGGTDPALDPAGAVLV